MCFCIIFIIIIIYFEFYPNCWLFMYITYYKILNIINNKACTHISVCLGSGQRIPQYTVHYFVQKEKLVWLYTYTRYLMGIFLLNSVSFLLLLIFFSMFTVHAVSVCISRAWKILPRIQVNNIAIIYPVSVRFIYFVLSWQN